MDPLVATCLSAAIGILIGWYARAWQDRHPV